MLIHIDNHFTSKVYTSSSPVSGHVEITTTRDIPFDKVQIALLGMTRCRVDGLHSPLDTCHTFLKLEMPTPESSYPTPRVYEAGRTYRVPFNFVIPEHLTLSACSHRTRMDAVRDHHLCLPPSMGDWELDDMAPDTTRIEYSIRSRLLRNKDAVPSTVRIMEATQPLKVLPTYPEQAPLNVTRADKLYTMSKSKSLRRTIISPKMGTVTLSAAQPAAVMVSADGHSASSVDVQLMLQIESASSSAPPPRLKAVTSKINAVTYYSATNIHTFPNIGDWLPTADASGKYQTTTSLGPCFLGRVIRHHALGHHHSRERRDSGYETDSGPLPPSSPTASTSSPSSTTNQCPVYCHTANIQVPGITLPLSKKTFIPTFHSCFCSRVYVLCLTVSLSYPGAAGAGCTTSLTLELPLQVGVEPGAANTNDNTARRRQRQLNAHPEVALMETDSTGLPTFEAATREPPDRPLLGYDANPVLPSFGHPHFHRSEHHLPGYGDVMPRTSMSAGNALEPCH